MRDSFGTVLLRTVLLPLWLSVKDFVGTVLLPWFGVVALFIYVLFDLKGQIDAVRIFRHSKKHGEEITGTIVDYTIIRGGIINPAIFFSPVFEFRYNGNTKRKAAFQAFIYLFMKTRFPEGEKIQIHYCEEHPDFVVMKGHRQYVMGGLCLLLYSIGAVFLFGLLFFDDFRISLLSSAAAAAAWWVRRRMRKKKNG